MKKWSQLSRRQQRKWRSPCCGAPKPWKHEMRCPVVEAQLRMLLNNWLLTVLKRDLIRRRGRLDPWLASA
jgi:hypothetical protein